MRISRKSIIESGTALAKESSSFAYDHVFIIDCFRIFYTLAGGTSPADLTCSNSRDIPDYIVGIAYKFVTARILLSQSLSLKDPLREGRFFAKGARYIDIHLQEIPREYGIASERVYDYRLAMLDETPFQGKSLRIKLHRNLIPTTATPIHELFHLYQYNYSVFNNMWFMEGLARWSQSIITKGTGKEEKLPSTVHEVIELLKKNHEAEFFWNRLAVLCDPKGTFDIPDALSKNNDGIVNNHRPGAELIKKILENTSEQIRLLPIDQPSRNLADLEYWPESEKKSPNNNIYILRSVIDAIKVVCRHRSEELDSFVAAATKVIQCSRLDFDNVELQSFLRTLSKCNHNLCLKDERGFLFSDHFDIPTRTLSFHSLDCSTLTDEDLETFHVLENIFGDLVVQNNTDITSLEGLRNLETIVGDLTISHSGVKNISGLNNLKIVKNLTIDSNNHLQGISGFNSLELVKKSVNITNNSSLQSINGFTCLTSVRSLIKIEKNESLEKINGFNSLNQVDYGSLLISGSPRLQGLRGFCRLTGLGGTLSINNCPELADFTFLSSLERVKNIEINNTKLFATAPLRKLFRNNRRFKGFIKLTSNRFLSDLSFMSGLETVGSSLYLHHNNLTDLKGLENLRRVGASLSLSANKLRDISQLAKLETIDGILGLSYNRLTTLHGLENLKSIQTKKWGNDLLSIKFNDNRNPDRSISLKDISALANVCEVTDHLVVYTDTDQGHQYQAKPGPDSIFSTKNTNFAVYGRSSKSVQPISHICDLPAGSSP